MTVNFKICWIKYLQKWQWFSSVFRLRPYVAKLAQHFGKLVQQILCKCTRKMLFLVNWAHFQPWSYHFGARTVTILLNFVELAKAQILRGNTDFHFMKLSPHKIKAFLQYVRHCTIKTNTLHRNLSAPKLDPQLPSANSSRVFSFPSHPVASQ